MPENWDAKKFLEHMLLGGRGVPEMLAELTPEQLAEIEAVLAEREANRATGHLQVGSCPSEEDTIIRKPT